MKLIGILLIVFGVLALAMGSFSYTKREKVLDIGPIEATAEEKHSVGIPDMAGVAFLVAGLVLVVVSTRRAGSLLLGKVESAPVLEIA